MKRMTLVWMAAGILMARDGDGIRPRPAAQDYPGHEQTQGFTVAAAVLPQDQVKHMFATDLSRYIVVEVAVYPEPGRDVELSPADFALKIGADGDVMRATHPRTVAGVNNRRSQPRQPSPGDINVYPTATVGYESGPVYDPVTGQRRGGGWYGGGGVGVGVGGAGAPPPAPRPGGTDRDRVTMQQELEDKGLPEGRVHNAVAGYLYFPRPSGKQRNALYEVSYYTPSGKVRVAVPPPQNK